MSTDTSTPHGTGHYRNLSDRIEDARAELTHRYPERWACLLLPVCEPKPHQHHGKDCPSPGKVPLDSGWNAKALDRWRSGSSERATHLKKIAQHVAGGGNVGLAVPSGVVVIDADSAKAVAWVAKVSGSAPRQATAKGAHFLFRLKPGIEIKASTGVELERGVRVDVRAGGKSQIVGEPSTHATGARYEWERPLPSDMRFLPWCPPAILKAISRRKGQPPEVKSSNGEASKHTVREGDRNSHLASEAGRMRRIGMTRDQINAALVIENTEACDPPLPDAEVRAIGRSIARYKPAPEEPPPPVKAPTVGKQDSRNLVREDQDRPPEPIHAATVQEILADRLPETRCERIVWEGNTTLLLGLAKQGKTYMAAQMALCLASGKPFLGLETERSKVLYISWEITLAGLLSRMRNIAEDCGLPDPEKLLRQGWLKFYAHRRDATVPRLDLAQDRDRTRLQQLLADTSTEVFFIDTLRKALPTIELKDDIGWSEALGWFNALARKTGLGQVLVDHGHRGRTGETAAAFAMGSQLKGTEIPCLVKLERTRKPQEPDRWSVEVDSWFDDPGTPLWYRRPQGPGEEPGCGCEPCDPPEPEDVGRKKGDVALEMERWLRERLAGGTAVGSAVIYEEAAARWHELKEGTLKRKLTRALADIGGTPKDVEGSQTRQTVWTL